MVVEITRVVLIGDNKCKFSPSETFRVGGNAQEHSLQAREYSH